MLAHHKTITIVIDLLTFLRLPQRQLTNVWNGEILQIFAPTHLGVHIFTHNKESRGERQGNCKCHQEYVVTDGSSRGCTAVWLGNDTGIISRESLRKFIFLTLLQKEEIQRLLDLLLTLDGQQMVRLLGVGRKFTKSTAVDSIHSTELGTEGGLGIVERIDNGAAQITECNVKVTNKGVLLTGVGYKVVTLQQFFIIRGNLRLYSRITNAAAGWQELLGMSGIGNIIAHITHHVELVVQVLTFLISRALFAHGLGSNSLDTGHSQGTLVTSNILIDITQLIFNDGQTLLDKLIGGHTDLVAVLHPVLVVDVNNGLQDILSTGNGIIYTDYIDNILGIRLQISSNEATIPSSRSNIAYTTNEDIFTNIFFKIQGGLNSDGTEQGLESLANIDRNFTTFLLATKNDFRDGSRTVAIQR